MIVCALSPISSGSKEEGIVICVNDEHLEKAEAPIEVTEEGIVICFNDDLLVPSSVYNYIINYKYE